MHKLAAVFLVVAVFNGVFFSAKVPIPGTLAMAVFIGCINGFTLLRFAPRLFDSKSDRNLRLSWVLLGLTGLATGMSLIRGNYFDRFILTAASLGLSSLNFYLLAKPKVQLAALSELGLFPVRLLMSSLAAIDTSVAAMLHLKRQSIQQPSWQQINVAGLVRGLIITVPALLVVVGLLSAGDAAFAEFIGQLLDLETHWIHRLLWSLGIIAVAVPLTYISIAEPFVSPLASKQYRRYTTEVQMLIGSLLLVMLVYLTVQAPYLFATVPETQLYRFGIQTYSEYVRRGFFELSLVSAIIYAATGLSYLVIRSQTSSTRWLMRLTLALIAVDLLFIGSIFRRVYLYSASHGLTLARIYGAIALIAVIGWTLTLIGRLVSRSKINWHYLEASIILGAILLPSLINPEKLIWKYAPPTVNDQTDYTYIARMDSDAAAGWIQAYQALEAWLAQNPDIFADYELSELEYQTLTYHLQTLWSLESHWTRLNQLYASPNWYETNFSDYAAYQQLKSQLNPLQVSQRKNEMQTFLQQYSVVNEGNIPTLDRSASSPLL